MLLEQDGRDFVVEAFRSGAVGVCERNQTSEMLCKCIYCVHNDQVWVNNQQLHYLLEAVSFDARIRLTDSRGITLLSDREEEIARLVAEAFTNREIAEQLKISERTVKNHMNHIFDRLGLSNRVELTRYSLAHRNILKYPASVNPSQHGTRTVS
jgi:DNA-binding NarL/FixJ family response regulator